MKKLFTLFLALVATTALWAADFLINGIYYNILADKTNELEVTYRGSYYYEYYDEYGDSVTIPETVTYYGTTYSVTSIGDQAFQDCSSLTSITIPNSVTSIGDHAFRDCISLTSPIYNAHCFAYMPTSYSGAYTIPEGIKQIAGGAFQDCSSLTSITIPNSVTSIGVLVFYGCSNLTSVTIPNSVTSIGVSAFSGCKSLTSITIPNSVKSIGTYAFYYCKSLTSVTSLAEVPPTLGNDAFYMVSKDIPVYVACGAVSAYQLAKGWRDFTNIQCMPEDESAVDNVHSPSANTQKFFRDGQLLIKHNDKIYDMMGNQK